MAKSVLLAMSHSLATELGEQEFASIPVAPGYIWGDTLKSYFDHQARQIRHYRGSDLSGDRGKLRSQTAANRRRWPQRFFFLASDLAQRHHRADPGRQW